MATFAPFIRILMRYVSGVLIARGIFNEGDAGLFMDPELIGILVGIANEAWYMAARKFGWEK